MTIYNLRKIKYLILFLLFAFCSHIYSNTLFGGIEIGSRGVKMTVLDVENAKKNLFTLKEFWTENVGIARGISIDGNLAPEDIDAASKVVLSNYLLLINKYKIETQNIFIVASSGVGIAKNTDVLANIIKELTNKEIEVISSRLESKLMFKGSIIKKYYLNSLILDIGSGNTKGGYVELKNDDINVFYPFNLNLGTTTLTEKIVKNMRDKNDTNEFIEKIMSYNGELNNEVKQMFVERPEFKDKTNIYVSGGASWAFFVLSGNFIVDNFSEFTYEDVQYYDAILKNNFKKITDLGLTSLEADKVLKTYSQKNLIAANTLLMRSLENLTDLDNKKIYFVKQGQIAWLLSYVADSAKGSKVIY